MATLGLVLLAAAAVGVAALALMLGLTVWHVRRPGLVPSAWPGISVLKPLCGADDDLAANIASFATLPYAGAWEVILGVRSPDDAAWPVAEEAVRRWPERMRLVRQGGEVGLNPKVNQLVGMARAARHDLLVVSDSNIRVPDAYLADIAAHLARPGVACVTHPIGGAGHRTLGALLDNLHLASSVATGMVAAERVARRPLVVGKSMALWRRDLELLGGFESVANVLAEDHALGSRIRSELRAGVAVSSLPVWNIAVEKSVGHFFRRYLRWSVIHRTAISFPAYLAESLLNPIPLAAIGYALRPTPGAAITLAVFAVLKPTLDAVAFSHLRRERFSWRAFGVVWLKDLLLFATWVHGLFARTVVWRGNRLRVHAGSRLVPLAEPMPCRIPDVTGFSETLPSLHGSAVAVMSDLRA
ncbi:MAG: glycosyltransferase [Myxococcaceae bacterium]